MRRLSLFCGLGVVLSALSIAGCASADTVTKTLAPGIVYRQYIVSTPPMIVNVVDVDLFNPLVHVGVGLGQDCVSGAGTVPDDGRESVSSYARRHGALVAINGDYFPYTGDPLGVAIDNGEIFSEPWIGRGKGGPRSALSLIGDGRRAVFANLFFEGDLQAADGARMAIDGIDRALMPNDAVVYSARFGPVAGGTPGGAYFTVDRAPALTPNRLIAGVVSAVGVQGAAPIPIPTDGFAVAASPGDQAAFIAQHIHVGDRVGFVLGVAPQGETDAAIRAAAAAYSAGNGAMPACPAGEPDLPDWFAVREAISGGPRLVDNGKPAVDWAAEGFDDSFANNEYPRTAVGTSKDNRHLILVTVDGRQALSRGASLGRMADLLIQNGAWNGINLDGGGSTSMAVAGVLVNSPEDAGSERRVADMLCVYSDEPAVPMAAQQSDPAVAESGAPQIALPAGQIIVGQPVRLHLTGVPSGAAKSALWQGPVSGGLGFVDQQGILYPTNPGSGRISAVCGGRLVTASVTVEGPAPASPQFALTARLVADPTGASNRSQVAVRIADPNGKPHSGVWVSVNVVGGTADNTRIQTSPDGDALFGITWNRDKGGSVTVSAAGLTPVQVNR